MKRLGSLFLLSCAGVWAQTLGQFRIVDFAARTPAVISSVQGQGITTAQPHGLNTGDAVYIYQPLTLAQDASIPGFGNHGNRGRGYFIVSVSDPTDFTLTSEMYTGATGGIGNGVGGRGHGHSIDHLPAAAGSEDLAGRPDPQGEWSGSTAYRTQEMVTSNGSLLHGHRRQYQPATTEPVLLGPGRPGDDRARNVQRLDRDTHGKAGSEQSAIRHHADAGDLEEVLAATRQHLRLYEQFFANGRIRHDVGVQLVRQGTTALL